MKLLFINNAYPKERYKQFWKESGGLLQVPGNVFQWAVVNGLECNRVDYSLVSVPALPVWPRYKSMRTPGGPFYINGKAKGHYLSYCTVPAVKQISRRKVLRKYISNWCENNTDSEQLIALLYAPSSDMLGAAVDVKIEYPNLIIAPIITDLIENALEFTYNRKPLKRIQILLEKHCEDKLFPKVDKFILLTSQMTDFIPQAEGKYIVVEGIAPELENIVEQVGINHNNSKTLLYTGVLEEYAGIRKLVDAFRQVRLKDVNLVICGTGSDAEYVKMAAEEDSRIVFRGGVGRDEVLCLQHEATLLINPRQPNGGITKYSFPSKTMEYMTSGTPMIGYRLEGMPSEYYDHMYTPTDLSIDALAACIQKTLSLPFDELKQKANEAARFIEKNKSSKKQVERILEFLSI